MKNKLLLYGAMLVMTMLLFSSCRKTVSHGGETNVYKEKITTWIDGNVVSSLKGQEYAADLKANLDYSRMKVEPSSNSEKIVIIPLNETFLQSRRAAPGQLGNFVLLMNNVDNIRRANIVLYRPDPGQEHVSVLPEGTFHDIFNTAKVKTDGTYNFLDVNGKLQYQLGYENGRMRSSGTVQKRSMADYRAAQGKNTIRLDSDGIGANISRANDETCLHFFLIIDWYDSSGVHLYSTWYYIGSVCVPDDENQVPQPDPGGGGGGFAGPDGNYWQGSPSYEYAVSREFEWTPYGLPYGYIMSKEQITGVKVGGMLDGGYFTGATHTSSWSSDALHSWTETMWHFVPSTNYLYLYLNGNIAGSVVNTSITENQVFSFASLFP